MVHYVLFCNAVAIYFRTSGAFTETFHRFIILRAFLTLNAFCSFDPLYFVSPALCLSPQIEDVDILYIDTLTTLYPFLLLIITCVITELHARNVRPIVMLWRPFHRNFALLRRSWNPNPSLVQVFSTLFYISYTKLLFLVYVPLHSIDFMDEKGNILNKLKVTYIDPAVPFLTHKHIYLIIFSACIFIFIVLPPILVLMMYSSRLCDKLHSRLSPRLNLALLTFVHTYQGCFKDGTNGTQDYRVLSGGFLVLYMLVPLGVGVGCTLVEVDERSPVILWQISIAVCIVLSVAFAVIRPYKSEIANHSGVSLFAILALYGIISLNLNTAAVHEKTGVVVAGVVLLSLPHVVFYGYIVYRVGRLFKEYDITVPEVLYVREPREQNEESSLLNHA